MRKALAAFGLMVWLPSCAAPQPRTPPSSSQISAHIRFLAHDLLEGRGTGERGHRLAAAYVASQLQALGIEPAGDNGSYFQEVQLRGARVSSAGLEILSPGGEAAHFVHERDFLATPDFVRGDYRVEAPLVFVGYGIESREYRYDDLHRSDVRGKVAIVFEGAPFGERDDFFPALPSAVAGDRRLKIEKLAQLGAVGVIFVRTPRRDPPWAYQVQSTHFEAMSLIEDEKLLPGAELPRFILRAAVFDELLRQAGRTERIATLVSAADKGSPQTFDLGLSVRLSVQSKVRSFTSPNVVGRLTKDRASPLASEAVLFSAHLDHIGIGDPVGGDRIYNGAGDDAAGCAMVLEIARAFVESTERPRRTLLFAFFTGEEKGLLGSEHFARHPPVPLERIATVLQSDFAAYPIFPLRDIEPLGAEHSSLENDVIEAARIMGLTLSMDSLPAETRFIRSDHYEFVRRGVPAVYPMMGLRGATPQERLSWSAFVEARYHQPADEWEPLRDYQPLADFAQFQFLIRRSVANRTERPQWKSHDFFQRFTPASASVGLRLAPASASVGSRRVPAEPR